MARSVGSVAPFVGLLGTVVGIISAFQGIASTGSGGLSSVSAGISEALAGKVVGFIDNAKPNFNHLVDDIGELLMKKHGVAKVLKRQKRSASVPAPDEVIREFAERCDLVALGVGLALLPVENVVGGNMDQRRAVLRVPDRQRRHPRGGLRRGILRPTLGHAAQEFGRFVRRAQARRPLRGSLRIVLRPGAGDGGKRVVLGRARGQVRGEVRRRNWY